MGVRSFKAMALESFSLSNPPARRISLTKGRVTETYWLRREKAYTSKRNALSRALLTYFPSLRLSGQCRSRRLSQKSICSEVIVCWENTYMARLSMSKESVAYRLFHGLYVKSVLAMSAMMSGSAFANQAIVNARLVTIL